MLIILEKYSLILIMTLIIWFCRDMQYLFKNMVFDLSQTRRVGWHLYFGYVDFSSELYPDYKMYLVFMQAYNCIFSITQIVCQKLILRLFIA